MTTDAAPRPIVELRQLLAMAAERFGPDQDNWQFVCPACGHIATVQQWKASGAPESAIGFSCVGRWSGAKRDALGKGPGPCNYAGGGLIGLNPQPVLMPNGKIAHFFELADTHE